MDQDRQVGDLEAALVHGRACYARRAWSDAFEALASVDARSALELGDLDRMAWAAALSGRDDAMFAALERMHQAHLDQAALAAAARCAFWLGFRLFALAESARAGAWLARAERLCAQLEVECVESGYLLLPTAIKHAIGADYPAARATAVRAREIAERFGDADLGAFARALEGRYLLYLGQSEPGFAQIDEAMLAAASGELSPLITGLVYCTLIAACQNVFAWERAREWTLALARWWETQPQLVAFTTSCLVHRVELMQLSGDWPEAVEQARLATEPLRRTVERSAAAAAFYQQGEIQRLRGEDAAAEQAYRSAHELGYEPQPGLALLRLRQGHAAAAQQSLRRVLAVKSEPFARVRFLPAAIEIFIAAGELDQARDTARELNDIARSLGGDVLAALAAHGQAACALAAGEPDAALAPLKEALLTWQRIGAPYIAARLRVLIARACRLLGDEDGAVLELSAAREVFERLGAAPDLVGLGALEREALPPTAANHDLSPRELQVLRLVAAGKTNKMIARELGLSEKTIDRHVSNIFTKIDASSRAGATAYAYEHKLI